MQDKPKTNLKTVSATQLAKVYTLMNTYKSDSTKRQPEQIHTYCNMH